MSLIDLAQQPLANPVDIVERIAATNDWSFDRASEDEVTLVVGGQWADYQVSFTWMSEIEALHLACAFDLKVPERRRGDMIELVARINEQLWVGHFDVWAKDGLAMFRHALLLAGGGTASAWRAAMRIVAPCAPASAALPPQWSECRWVLTICASRSPRSAVATSASVCAACTLWPVSTSVAPSSGAPCRTTLFDDSQPRSSTVTPASHGPGRESEEGVMASG